MIISASYKTDIPTFYGEWFMNRVRAGYCKMVNPYSQQVHRVDLTPEQVDGFVFWTKNVGPFIKHLAEIQTAELPFHCAAHYHRLSARTGISRHRLQPYRRGYANAGRCLWSVGGHLAL